MATSILPGAILMGIVAAAVVVAVGSTRRWYRYAPETTADADAAPVREGPPVDETTLWIGGFLVLGLAAVVGVFSYLDGGAEGGLLAAPVLAVAAAVVSAYALVATWASSRQSGQSPAIAAGKTSAVAGVLLLLAVAGVLLV